jgi:hypothetical protein
MQSLVATIGNWKGKPSQQDNIIINKGKIIPKPSYVGNENGATVIYWNISRMANYTNLSIKYSLSAPISAGNYTFRADASCFDSFWR